MPESKIQKDFYKAAQQTAHRLDPDVMLPLLAGLMSHVQCKDDEKLLIEGKVCAQIVALAALGAAAILYVLEKQEKQTS